MKRLEAEDVPCAVLLSRMELMNHEQIVSNDSIIKVDMGAFGEVRQAKPAARFDVTPAVIDKPAPKLGEHSRDILSELGYSQAEQDKMIYNKAVKTFGG